jgi:COMPASS component SWD2
MNPGDDTFLSCSSDDTLRIWDLKSPNAIGKLFLSQPHLAAFDPSANVFAVASPSAQTILLYDFRNFDKEPFAAFDTLQAANSVKPGSCNMNWTKLEFSNDGKSLLVGTAGHGHYVLDAFDGSLKQYLTRKAGGVRRLFAGEKQAEGIAESEKKLETSGDVCFSPDGRYVLSGQYKSNVLVYDIATPSQEKSMPPTHELELKTEASVIQYNPRFNMFATADRDLHLWAPDRDAL